MIQEQAVSGITNKLVVGGSYLTYEDKFFLFVI